MTKCERFRRALAFTLCVAGAGLIAGAAYIPAKAALAQVLLERAWDRAQAGERHAKPWPWADISPVAEIEVPRLKQRAIVLEDSSGSAMAFGPGHLPNSAAIGARGTAIITAHRDTTFRFLRDVRRGDDIVTVTGDGRRTVYRVVSLHIVRADASGLDAGDGGPTHAQLALVTCYPFDGMFHSPWRYIVLARKT
jgi:sortase A